MAQAGGVCRADERLPAQDTVVSDKLNLVDFHDGHLSVSADNILLVELLQLVGTEAGFEVVTFGDHDTQTSSWSFSNLPLAEAIEILLSRTSAMISYGGDIDSSGEPSVAAVYLLGPRPTETNTAAAGTQGSFDSADRFNTTEPNLANQILADQARYGDLQDRMQAIDRLAGLADDVTVTILVFSLQHDPDPSVRARAVTALEQIGGEVAATGLETGLGDGYPSVRMKVVQALGNVHDERVPLWLGQTLFGDSSVDVRLNAVQAMAQQGGDTARLFLEAAAEDSSSVVSEAALGLLGGPRD